MRRCGHRVGTEREAGNGYATPLVGFAVPCTAVRRRQRRRCQDNEDGNNDHGNSGSTDSRGDSVYGGVDASRHRGSDDVFPTRHWTEIRAHTASRRPRSNACSAVPRVAPPSSSSSPPSSSSSSSSPPTASSSSARQSQPSSRADKSNSSGSVSALRDAQSTAARLAHALAHNYPQHASLRVGAGGMRALANDNLTACVARAAALTAAVARREIAVLGVMITASHNPAEQNGIKLLRSDGGLMMTSTAATPAHVRSQNFAASLADAITVPRDEAAATDGSDSRHAAQARQALRLRAIINAELGECNVHDNSERSVSDGAHCLGGGGAVVIGHDNRASSPALAHVVAQMVLLAGGSVRQIGVTTTPYAQYCVRAMQAGRDSSMHQYVEWRLARGYRALRACLAGTESDDDGDGDDTFDTRTELLVDCAYGTGGVVLEQLAPLLDFPLRCVHTHRDRGGVINERVGAEYAHTRHLSSVTTPPGGARTAALDGDADRVVYFSRREDRARADVSDTPPPPREYAVDVRNGDWMAIVVTSFLAEQVAALRRACGPRHVHFGCVLTAYTNGAYLERVRHIVESRHADNRVVLVPTGVQFLHDAAVADFDVAAYFEPNGHGAVVIGRLFRETVLATIAAAAGPGAPPANASTVESASAAPAARILIAVARLMNDASGDAVALLLLVEALERSGYTARVPAPRPRASHSETVWFDTREPTEPQSGARGGAASAAISASTRQSSSAAGAGASALAEPDTGAQWIRRVSRDETRVLDPPDFQQRVVDACVSSVPGARAFVRASQTERCVRVYAEADGDGDDGENGDDARMARALAARIARETRRHFALAASSSATATAASALPPLPSWTAPTAAPIDANNDRARQRLRDALPSAPALGRSLPALPPDAVVGIVLAAGQGSRFRAAYPKVVHSFLGKPLAAHALDALRALDIPSVVVVGHAREQVMRKLGHDAHAYAVQEWRGGTGHAVYAAYRACLQRRQQPRFDGDVVVMYGDTPGVDAAALSDFLRAHRAFHRRHGARYAGMLVSGRFASRNAGAYGRVVRDTAHVDAAGNACGSVRAVVERNQIGIADGDNGDDESDSAQSAAATQRQLLAIREFNSGIVVARARAYFDTLGDCAPRDRGAHKRAEYFATDFVQLAVARGGVVEAYPLDESSGEMWRVEGANTVDELCALERAAAGGDERGGSGDGAGKAVRE